MKFFLLTCNHWADVGSSQSMVVSAPNEERAREIAKECEKNDGWLNIDFADCEDVSNEQKERVILNYLLSE